MSASSFCWWLRHSVNNCCKCGKDLLSFGSQAGAGLVSVGQQGSTGQHSVGVKVVTEVVSLIADIIIVVVLS